jgi:hypothetical protein
MNTRNVNIFSVEQTDIFWGICKKEIIGNKDICNIRTKFWHTLSSFSYLISLCTFKRTKSLIEYCLGFNASPGRRRPLWNSKVHYHFQKGPKIIFYSDLFQSNPYTPWYFKSNIIYCCEPYLYLPICLFLLGFLYISHFPHTCYMPHLSDSPLSDDIVYETHYYSFFIIRLFIRCKAQIKKSSDFLHKHTPACY